jgi:dUTP pyrophosphatase
MNSTVVYTKKTKENATLPTRGSAEAAGYDLYATLDVDELAIAPHTTEKIDTGLAIELPSGTFGAIFARSGLASKKGLRPSNCIGVIDSDYRGSVIVALHNDTDSPQSIKNGERIAQLIVLPYIAVTFEETDTLISTERGEGGFGSTGTN